MAESSYFWDGTTVGDATLSPYDAATEFAAAMSTISGTRGLPFTGGVARGFEAALLVTGVASPLSVGSGSAVVYGSVYRSDVAISQVIPTPGASTRIDMLVLRKDWTAKTIRLTRIAGVEGGAAPALVNTFGTTWDIPLAQVSITTGGVITLTDQRQLFPTATPGVLNFIAVSPPGAVSTLSRTGAVGPSQTGILPALPATAVRVKLFVEWLPGANVGTLAFFDSNTGGIVQSFDLIKDAVDNTSPVRTQGDVACSGSMVWYKSLTIAAAWNANIYVVGYWLP